MLMKWASVRVETEKIPLADFWISPVPSTTTAKRRVPRSAELIRKLVPRLCAFLFCCILCWWGYLHFVPQFHPSVVVQSYLAALPLYLLGQTFSLIQQLMYPPRWIYPAHHRYPPLSASLSDFWGYRWNTHVADWLRQMIFIPMRTKPIAALFWAFLLSGVWHELIVNVPLYLFCGVNLLGSMVVFFLIQASGIAIQRRMKSPLLKRFTTWAFVWGACPLILNEGILRTFGLIIR